MANKELDRLIESYFATTKAPAASISFEMLVEMIQESITDSYPDITSRSDPAGFDTNINPEMIATKVPPGAENDRPTIAKVVAQVMGAPDPAMVDSVMMHFDDHQGLATRGSPSSGGGNIRESRLPPEQWKELYRQLLMVGVDSDMVEAIKMLADSGMTKDDLQAMLTQNAMQDARGMQQMNEGAEGKESRFSYTISLPKLVPTEAWGNPDSQDRAQINKVFNTIRGGANMQKRIEDLNKFLTPETAKRRRSPNVILNMMMITEALQATLNDYNESSAGFVFEAFMAALTGGKQIAGRVKGTLPIEDFEAFSEIGASDDPAKSGAPVSLKLLSGATPIKGSFTNLMDYLFVRGKDKISYLIAYKLTVGGKVERLQLFDFMITRENVIDVMIASKNEKLVKPVTSEQYKAALKRWEKDGSLEGLSAPGPMGEKSIAQLIVSMPGYTDAGFMTDAVPDEESGEVKGIKLKDDDPFAGLSDEEAEKKRKAMIDAEREEKLSGQYGKARDVKGLQESFHQAEKRMMKEESLMMEGKGDAKSQWGISRAQMDKMTEMISLVNYGELNLSQGNIDELLGIYSEILGTRLQALLDNTKELTENIGRYYTESKRKRGWKGAVDGIDNAKNVQTALSDDPLERKKDSE